MREPPFSQTWVPSGSSTLLLLPYRVEMIFIFPEPEKMCPLHHQAEEVAATNTAAAPNIRYRLRTGRFRVGSRGASSSFLLAAVICGRAWSHLRLVSCLPASPVTGNGSCQKA